MKMNPILQFGLFGLLLGCSIAGCKDSDSDAPVLPESRLTLNPGELSVPREGGEVKFTISTNRGWGMKKTGGAWFEWAREATGLASDSVVGLNVQANPEASSRTATITVMAGTKVGELKVTQFGLEPEIILPVTEKVVSCDGASFVCVVNANTAIAGVSSDAWIQAEEVPAPASLCSRVFRIRVEANTGEARNGKVSFSGEEGGNAELLIQQKAFEVKVSFTDKRMSVSGLQTEAFVTVNSNIDWTAEIIPAESGEPLWASFKGANFGKANVPAKLEFTLEPNESGMSRMLSVIIHAGDKNIPLLLEQTAGQTKRERDSSALVVLYNSASKHGDQAWNLHQPVNTWKGVRVNREGVVLGLDLQQWEFKGNVPEEMGQLRELTTVAFNQCVMNGQLPESINELEELESLEITLTKGKVILPLMDKLRWLTTLKLTGLTKWGGGGYPVIDTYLEIENAEAIGGLSGLNFLDLSATSLTAFPKGILNLEFVHTITASYSKIAVLPAEWGNLKNLKTLIINNSDLQGEIPAELFNAPNLTTVELDNNKLSGELKLSMFTSQSMRALSLSNNDLTGNIPVELATVSKITTISVRNNRLGNRMKTAKIPEEILADSRFTGTASGGEGSGQGQVKPSWFGPTNICTQRDSYGWSNCPTE